MKIYKAIGLMSGTSLDGVDIAYCTFGKKENRWTYNLVEATTVEYPKLIQKKLKSIHQATAEELLIYDKVYGSYLGEIASRFFKENAFSPDFIASHGHTIFHQPDRGLTFQLGHGAAIASKAKITVISDFRSMDVSLKGQGAPLVPIGDLLLFNEFHYCLNIGGIANISSKEKLIKAYDICPANMVLNHLMQDFDKAYDDGGKYAAEGSLDRDLLQDLNAMDFYQRKEPKSLGREWVEKEIFPIIDKYQILQKDKLRTYVEHIALQVSMQLKKANMQRKMLITGGGAHNSFLIERIEALCSDKLEVHLPNNQLIDYKEALIFGFLGVLRMERERNSLSSVTGAIQDSIGGAIYTYLKKLVH